MQKKNRAMTLTVTIPDHYESDDDVLLDLMERLDAESPDWSISLGGDHSLEVSKVRLGNVEIEPEE